MKIRFYKKFERDVEKLRNPKIKTEIEELIILLEEAEKLTEIPNLKKMKGNDNAYRIRLKDYRVGFFLENQTINLARVLSRKDIYKYFP